MADQTTALQLFEANKVSFEKVLPNHMTPDRMTRLALGCIKRNPKLAQSDPMAFLGAIMQACSVGLEIDTPLGHCYMVPHKGKASLIIGYKGMIELAYRSQSVAQVTSHVVFENDVFAIEYGTEEKIKHVPCIDGDERGKAIGAYAVVSLKSGGKIQRFLPIKEILSARPSHWQKTPWGDKNEHVVHEMYMKTALRRTLKTSPQSTELAKAVHHDEMQASGHIAKFNRELGEAAMVAEATVVEQGESLADMINDKPTEPSELPNDPEIKRLVESLNMPDKDLEALIGAYEGDKSGIIDDLNDQLAKASSPN